MKKYKIKKTKGLTLNEILFELDNGGRIVIYSYCVSPILATLRLASSPHFIRPDEKISKYRLKYIILSLIFGWWGLPHGPIFTIDMVKYNLKTGGIDVTEDIAPKIIQQYSTKHQLAAFTSDLIIEFEESELTSYS